jgi:transcriptional regulator of acetoin/glycerol metabolism
MDLIDRMIRRLQHIEPHLTADRVQRIETALRAEFGGVVTRTRKRSKNTEIEDAVRAKYDGDVARLAADLGCHRSTVYRVLSGRLRKVAKE